MKWFLFQFLHKPQFISWNQDIINRRSTNQIFDWCNWTNIRTRDFFFLSINHDDIFLIYQCNAKTTLNKPDFAYLLLNLNATYRHRWRQLVNQLPFRNVQRFDKPKTFFPVFLFLIYSSTHIARYDWPPRSVLLSTQQFNKHVLLAQQSRQM